MIRVLLGGNSYLKQLELTNIVKSFVDKYTDNIERFDASELDNLDTIINAVRSVSFLDSKKLVIIKNFCSFRALLENIESFIQAVAESTELILIDEKIDKRSKAYRYLTDNTDISYYNQLESNNLIKWVGSQAKTQRADINFSNAKYLVELLGPNQQLIKNELDKLILSGSAINKQLIDEMVEPRAQSRIFDLLEALFRGDSKKAWELYLDQRAQGEEPQKIIAMITWQLQQLVLAVFAKNKTTATLIKAGVSPYTARKSLEMSHSISKDDLKNFIKDLAELDLQSKTKADVGATMEVYFSGVALSRM